MFLRLGPGHLAPLVYYHGSVSLSDDAGLYRLQAKQLLEAVGRRGEMDARARASGMIVNTCGFVEGVGAQVLKALIGSSRADVVLVLGSDKLYGELGGVGFPQKPFIRNLEKSSGVMTRPSTLRREARSARYADLNFEYR